MNRQGYQAVNEALDKSTIGGLIGTGAILALLAGMSIWDAVVRHKVERIYVLNGAEIAEKHGFRYLVRCAKFAITVYFAKFDSKLGGLARKYNYSRKVSDLQKYYIAVYSVIIAGYKVGIVKMAQGRAYYKKVGEADKVARVDYTINSFNGVIDYYKRRIADVKAGKL